MNLNDPYPWYNRDGDLVSIDEWSRLMRDFEYRKVAQEHVTAADGTEYFISTVFLGIDTAMGRGGPPILFETMVFDAAINERGNHDVADWGGRQMVRYPTLESAREGHTAAVMLTRAMGAAADDATAETTTNRKTK